MVQKRFAPSILSPAPKVVLFVLGTFPSEFSKISNFPFNLPFLQQLSSPKYNMCNLDMGFQVNISRFLE